MPDETSVTCSYCGHPVVTSDGPDEIEARVHRMEDALANLGTVLTGQLRNQSASSDPVAFKAFSDFQAWAIGVHAGRGADQPKSIASRSGASRQRNLKGLP